jgi:transposase
MTSKVVYTEEFKIEAVKQVTDKGYTQTDVAVRLGVNRKTMNAWVRRYGPNSVQHQTETEQSTEIRRLKAELKRVTEEREILKKAAAYFAKESV